MSRRVARNAATLATVKAAAPPMSRRVARNAATLAKVKAAVAPMSRRALNAATLAKVKAGAPPMSHRVALNAATLAAVKVAAPLLSFAVVVAVSRKLGVAGLGRYSLAYAWLGVFGLLAPLGLPALLTREGARDPRALGRWLATGLALSAVVSSLLMLAMAAAGAALGYDRATVHAVMVLSLGLVPSAWSNCLDAAWLALERTEPVAVACLVEHAAKVGLGVALLWSGFGLPAVLAAAVAGKVAACAFSLVWLQRHGISTTTRVDFASLRSLASQTCVFAASALCATLFWRVDVFLLSALRGVAEVGYYTAAYRLLDAAILLPQSLCQALYPRLAAGVSTTAGERWLFALTAPVALGVTVGAPRLLEFLYGPSLTPALIPLVVLTWTTVPYAWNRYQACRLVVAGRQAADLTINAGLLAANVAGNLALIPRYGSTGAAAVTLATALAYGAVQWAFLKRGRPAPAWI